MIGRQITELTNSLERNTPLDALFKNPLLTINLDIFVCTHYSLLRIAIFETTFDLYAN
jgi:hypothetical protein